MIIIFSNSDINEQSKLALLAKKPQRVFSLEDISVRAITPLIIDVEDDTLTIIDLNANGNLQKLYAPRVLAKQLAAIGFLENLKIVQLLVSDIVPETSMLGFATDLSRGLIAERPDAAITVQVPARIVECTLIEPPNTPEGDWSLYRGSHADVRNPPKTGVVDYFKSKMRASYTGAIEEAFKSISPQTVRATYGTSDDFLDNWNFGSMKM